MKKLIYIADDDEDILGLLDVFLKDAGFLVETFTTGDALKEQFDQVPCDLVVLDVMMPGTDGLSICKALRSRSSVPIIMLTAKESEPFSPSILVMRIKALLRRTEKSEVESTMPRVYSFHDLTLDLSAHRLMCNGVDVRITMTEFLLMEVLMETPGSAISRNDLLDRVWGIRADVETRVTDETIRRIRKKLKANNSRCAITAVWGYGYRLEDSDNEDKN